MKRVWVVQYYDAHNDKKIQMFIKEPKGLLESGLVIDYYILEFDVE